ncbi:MAG: NAD-dependent epimerase/dehydratase family protein [Planctomycetota bacterium]|nr:NAD-dependent epimerase/dehydratase family protein [Planctomycetota bacterium]
MLDLADQRILLTGGSGFLGRAVRHALNLRGVPAHAILAPTRGACDLTRQDQAERLVGACFEGRGPTLILHLAGFVGGLGANRQWPSRFFHDNLVMTLHLVEACRAAGLLGGLTFVQVGTMCSYPADAPCPYREDDLWRGRPDAEIASYGVAKLATHQLLESYRLEHALRFAYVIPTGFFGPGDNTNPATSHVAGALTKKYVDAARAGAARVVNWGSGAPLRDLLYIDDAAEGLLRAAEVVSDGTPINLTGGREVSIRELAGIVAGLAGFKGETVWDTSKGDGQARRSLDGARAAAMLGWSPRVTLEEGLARTVAWYRANAGDVRGGT